MTIDSRAAARRLLAGVGPFSGIGGRQLRPYQLDCAGAIVDSVVRARGRVFTVMFARQMGKNETSAQIEAYLLALYAGRGGTLIKAAPSFKPQVINSMLRLQGVLESNPATRGRWKGKFGYMMGVGKASISFFSADRHANVVGATASLLLEIDEAQDVDPDKYDRDFRPMASSTNATTVLYGTAWAEDSLLERQRRWNLEYERRTGERLHFEYDWSVLAGISPAYRAFVEAEIARLGESHPSIGTQYFLRCLSDAGRLFSGAQRSALAGIHGREGAPEPGCIYVAGIDIAGEDEQAEDAAARALVPRRDSTVVTIGRFGRDETGNPAIQVIDHVWWTGRDHAWQYERLLDLWRHWGFARVCVDASGIGAGIASFLSRTYRDRVEEFVFSAPSKSALAYGMLAMVNTGRLSIYGDDGSEAWRECWKEIGDCRYWLRAGEQMGWGVPPTEGHDDFVISLALCCRAAEGMPPPAAAGLVRAPRPPDLSEW